MAQKTHPIGLRVGLWQRKWNNTWYASNNSYKKIFFSHYHVDQFLHNFFTYYSYTKKSRIKRVLLVNTRFIKTTFNLGFLFVFFYKLRNLIKTKNKKKRFIPFYKRFNIKKKIIKSIKFPKRYNKLYSKYSFQQINVKKKNTKNNTNKNK